MNHAQHFVCAINRNRDAYQVPLALAEAGLLAQLVTDFYAPERWRNALPAPLRRRHAPGLPSSAVTATPSSFALQAAAELLRLPMRPVFGVTDRMLARKAAGVAARHHAHLYCYGGYLPAEHAIKPGTRRILFEYHPVPGLERLLLDEDAARFPQVHWSHARSRAALACTDSGWARADAVVCASAMTRRSLEHAGCDPARIAVVPYGTRPLRAAPARRTDTGRVEFLFVGQGVQRKGLHHLIDAWQAADLPDAQLTLVCYAIDPGIVATIRSPSVRLLPKQSPDELAALYARSHVFAMPSLVEGFGLVYLDALAQGCHVIGTANTGLPDLKLPATATTLVAPGDIPGLAEALRNCHDAALAGTFDPGEIAQASAAWQWPDFRCAIGAHAKKVLSH